MDPRHLFVDERMLGFCAFCGEAPDTRDHVPSKIFLDDPLPDNLPIVEACLKCNQGFSLDEEYLACFLDAVISGTAQTEMLARVKTRRALSRNPRLAKRIAASVHSDPDGHMIWTPENERVSNIVAKLASGHAAYELSLPRLDAPLAVGFAPFAAMSEHDRTAFENAEAGGVGLWPEFGSRAFLRALGAAPYQDNPGPWIEIQSGRYRYSVDQDDGVIVRFVLSEYLACQVVWE